MNPSTGITIRGDLNVKVEEAAKSDGFYIGQYVMPPYPVQLKSGQYPKIVVASGNLMKAGSAERASKSEYKRLNRQWTSDSYDCIDRGLEEAVDDADAKDVGRFFDAESTTARLVYRHMANDYEIRVASAIMSVGTFGTATAAEADYTSANIATIDFPADILAAIERINDNGNAANTIVLSSAVLNRVKLSTRLQNFCRGTVSDSAMVNLTAQNIADAFRDNGITKVLVGRGRYDSSNVGAATAVKASIWTSDYIWVGDVQGGPPDAGGAGRTFVWNEEGGLFVTETYREDKLRSTVVRVRQNTTEKVIDSTCGTLIDTNYA